MRTTIELTEHQRAELLKLAARRGLKGFSQLVQEALNVYLRHQLHQASLIDKALKCRGVLQGSTADEFEQRVEKSRRHWR